MKDKKVRVVVEFDIDNESIEEKGITPEDVLNGIVLLESELIDGFEVTTDIDGYNRKYDMTLCNGKILSKGIVKE